MIEEAVFILRLLFYFISHEEQFEGESSFWWFIVPDIRQEECVLCVMESEVSWRQSPDPRNTKSIRYNQLDEFAKQNEAQNYTDIEMDTMKVHGTKVISLTTRGLTDVRTKARNTVETRLGSRHLFGYKLCLLKSYVTIFTKLSILLTLWGSALR